MYKFNCNRCKLNLKDFNEEYNKYYCNCIGFKNSIIFYHEYIEINIYTNVFSKYILYPREGNIYSVSRVDFIENKNAIIRVLGSFHDIYNKKIEFYFDKNLTQLQIADYFYYKFILNEIFI
jgi:hypothetical protein